MKKDTQKIRDNIKKYEQKIKEFTAKKKTLEAELEAAENAEVLSIFRSKKISEAMLNNLRNKSNEELEAFLGASTTKTVKETE